VILPRRDALGRRLARSLLPPAVVLDVSFVNGLEAIRSLAAAGAPVIAVDHRQSALGFRSRLAHHVLSPDPMDEEAYVSFLAALAEREFSEPAVVLPTHDAPLAAVARNAARLAAYQLPGSGWDVLEPLQKKRHQYAVAEAAGIGVPLTFAADSEDEARVAAAALSYPAVVKPGDPIPFKRRFGRPVLLCQTPDELMEAWRSAADCEPLLQEVIPGDDATLWTVGSYTDASGAALGLFCGRKLLQMPRGFGTCRVGEARWRDDIVEQALALLAALGYQGIAQTEFRLDPRDERFKLMEVNPRLWQWHGLARACGVDLPRIAYLDVLGRPQRPVRSGPQHDGRRWVVAAAHLRASRQEGTSLRRALREIGPGAVEGTFDVRDPLPAIVQASGLVTAPIARRLHRRGGKGEP
jgi:predicted ATP-grasp superfamily ATP-dependent carboligase